MYIILYKEYNVYNKQYNKQLHKILFKEYNVYNTVQIKQ